MATDCQPCSFSIAEGLPPYQFYFEMTTTEQGDHAVRSIRVQRGTEKRRSQVLRVPDLNRKMQSFDKFYWMEAKDINFDGYADLFLMSSHGYGLANVWGDYWLFDPRSERFRYLGEHARFRIDTQRKRLLNSAKSSAVDVVDKEYAFGGGKLILLRSVEQFAIKDSADVAVIVRERVGNRLVVVRRERFTPPPD